MIDKERKESPISIHSFPSAPATGFWVTDGGRERKIKYVKPLKVLAPKKRTGKYEMMSELLSKLR